MGTSVVVFDWYNTLARPDPTDWWVRLADLIADAGGRPDANLLRVWEQEHPVEHHDHSADETTYRAWQRRRLDRLFSGCDLDSVARTDLLDAIEHERYTREFEVFDDVPDALEELRRRGVAVGLCSNWDWDLDRHLVRTGIAEHLDFVVCSARLGCQKPHPAIFAEALARAGSVCSPRGGVVRPGDVMFVGDSWHHDIAGAHSAGFRPVHLMRGGPCDVGDHGDAACAATAADVLALLD